MSQGRLHRALLKVFGDRDEVTIGELRAALFVEYSEAELLRRGVNSRGKKRKMAVCYEAGDAISEHDRWRLRNEGINFIIRVGVRTKSWIKIDKERGVVTRVRS